MYKRYIFGSGFVLYYILLLYVTATTPLIPAEVDTLEQNRFTFAHIISSISYHFMPSILGMRLGFWILSIVVAIAYYIYISTRLKPQDKLETLALFLLLPGFIASSVLVSDSIVAILFTILFLYSYHKKSYILSTLWLVLLFFTNTAVFALYFGVVIYSLYHRDMKLFWVSLVLFVLSLIWGSFSFTGKPQGHLLELLGLYSAVFSPLLFIYYFYSLYRSLLEGRRELLWYIAFSALALSMLLSIRQQIHIVDFSPYLIVGIVLAIETYLRSLRVRLPRFQYKYRLLATITISVLVLSSFVLIFNKELYRLSRNNPKIFVAPIYRPYDLAKSLKSQNKNCFNPLDVSYRYHKVMPYYGLNPCF